MSLVCRLLASEMSKREELEMLRAHQEQLLHSERQQKEGLELELEHLQQETLLGVTQRQLQDMCRERENGEVKIRVSQSVCQLGGWICCLRSGSVSRSVCQLGGWICCLSITICIRISLPSSMTVLWN